MEEFDRDSLTKLLRSQIQRPSYIVEVLKFTLGREPTQNEIDQVKMDAELRSAAHKKWLLMQPWHIRKQYISRTDRIKIVLMERYGVPKFLTDPLDIPEDLW